ncbi:autotransporter-associated beta strand repeat-containing protein [Luteolibacter marinus]|uniref:rhamnogalacturonan lyase family protein n=1 Tax=Luteolibacter marinus TaxID=2776705 RepID=UPI001865D292|nr:autotransporter-associated beta strand repeat-containing protein [Luteolibacter marinus]
MKRLLLFLLLLALPAAGQRQMENLNRGLVAVRKSSSQVYLSWRLFGDDPSGIAFNLYRSANGGAAIKLNGTPLTATTDFTDTPGSSNLNANAYSYFVRPVIDGVEQPASETRALPANPDQKQFQTLPLRGDTGPAGPYTVKFCWVGDLDGDGDYDYVVDRLSTLGENEQFLEAYLDDGTFLWRMAMGPNSLNQYAHEPGASTVSVGQTDNVTVYDLDGDGRAEVLVRTANGVSVTDAGGSLVASISAPDNSSQFLSVIDGLSGGELARAPMPNAWAAHGTLTNKAMIAYLDGKRPSVVFHGHNRADSLEFYYQFSAFDYRNGVLSQRWTLPQDPRILPGAEGHQIRVADVDNDGKDEICDLGHVVDDDGTQLFHNELTHGDRFHIADIDPGRPGLETFAIQQYNPTSLATCLYESGTGAMIRKWYSPSSVDVGRGIALDISSAHTGYEMYSTQPGIFNARGEQIYANNVWAPEGLWWDGDLGREFIDGAGSGALNPVINKFNAATGYTDRVWSLYSDWGAYSLRQAYGGRPAFWGDILGDWREELVLVQSDNTALRIYTTTTPATNRLYTLMHNPQYRCQTTTKGYVQASYVDYYLGYGMDQDVPPPPMVPADLTWNTGVWDNGSSASWTDGEGNPAVFAAGAAVLFDLSGNTASPVTLDGSLSPSAVTFFNPDNVTLDGTAGALNGSMTLSKSGAGTVTLTGSHGYSGGTTVWDGALRIDGTLTQSPVTLWGGTWGGALAAGETGGRLAGSGTVGQAVTLNHRAAITPGAGMGAPGTLTLGSHLTAADGSVLALDLSDDPTGIAKANDRIEVAGDLVLSGTAVISIHAMDSQLAAGTYTLLTYGGSLTGSTANFAVTVPEGTPYQLSLGAGSLDLVIPETREPGAITWSGGAGGDDWDLATTPNWSSAGTPEIFVAGDSVTFDATGAGHPNINLAAILPTAGVTVTADSDYHFAGDGALSGPGGLTKSGTGTLTLATENTYTGPTTVSGGTLAVQSLGDAGNPGSIGAATADPSNLTLDGATLALVGLQTSTNRGMTLGPAGGTISIPATSLQVSGTITGSGTLTKTGPGTLILAAPNSHVGGTVIREGTVSLASDAVNVAGLGTGALILDGGTLTMTNSLSGNSPDSIWPIHVPEGAAGRINADGRCTLSGALTGSGEFTFLTPYVRTDLKGDWSAFSGNIHVIADADGGDLRIMNPAGYPAAGLDLGDDVYAYYNSSMGSSFAIAVGRLSGSPAATLLGGPTSGRTLTWQVGGRNEDSTFSGTIKNSTGAVALTKVGTGTLTLDGDCTYTGTTTVSGGRLRIDGSTTGSNFVVQNGATLGGTGSITGNVSIDSGGAIEHLQAGDPPLAIAGDLAFGASAVIRPAPGISLAEGTFTVLTYSGSLTGTPAISWEAPPGSSLTASFDTTTPGVISMALTQPAREPGPILWTGDLSNDWDTVTGNWTAGGDAATYQTGDSPSFTDTGSGEVINLPADVQPLAVTVAADKDYTFTGNGVISGQASIAKSGNGTLYLPGIHPYDGGTTVSGGVLAITQTGGGSGAIGGQAGTGTLSLSNGGSFRMGSNNGKNFPANPIAIAPGSSGGLSSVSLTNGYGGAISGDSGSTFTLSGPISMGGSGFAQFGGFTGTAILSAGSQLRFSSTGGANGNGGASTTFQVDGLMNTRNNAGAGGVVLGALTGSGRLEGQTNTPAGNVNYIVGGNGTDSIFNGVIANGGNGTASLTKVGTGVLTLTGAHTYTGPTLVSGGTLRINGSLAATTLTVDSALAGIGTIAGAVTCPGNLAPGDDGAGRLTLQSGLSLAASSTLAFELGPDSDKIIVEGPLVLDGTLDIAVLPGFGPGNYTLITYSDSLTDNALLPGSLPTGYTASIEASAGTVRLLVAATITPFEQWQIDHFGNTGNPDAAADADPDHDGTDNATEFRLGLDPKDGRSAFRASGISGPDGFTLGWPFAPGLDFEIRRSTVLDAAEWELIGTVSGAGTFTDASPPAGTAFYRIHLLD